MVNRHLEDYRWADKETPQYWAYKCRFLLEKKRKAAFILGVDVNNLETAQRRLETQWLVRIATELLASRTRLVVEGENEDSLLKNNTLRERADTVNERLVNQHPPWYK